MNRLSERPAFHREDAMTDLEAEARRRVHVHAARPLLVPLVLPDVPEIVPLDDDRVLHPGRHNDAFEHLASNRESAMERTLRIRARRRWQGDVDRDVSRRGADRPGGCGRGGRFLLRLLFRHLVSPGLLHAVFRSKANLVPVDFEAAGDIETESAPVLRDPLFLPLHLDHEHVARLIDDAPADMLLARIGRVDDLHPEADQLVLPEVRHHVSSPAGAGFAATAFVGAPACPASSSSRMIVRMRAMFLRSARILPGFGGAPPMAATPRSCISSSRNSLSFFAIVSASIARVSFFRTSAITSPRLLPSPRRRRLPLLSSALRLSSTACLRLCSS